jgi:hypothetical protein
MSDTTLAVAALTADDLKTLRSADSLCFHWKDGATFVCAFRHLPAKGAYPATDVRADIALDDAQIVEYDKTRTPRSASWVITSSRYHAELMTVFGLLRPGDRLRPRWVSSNNNDHVDRIGHATEEFRLLIHRSGAKGKTSVLTFLIETVTTGRYGLMRNVSVEA